LRCTGTTVFGRSPAARAHERGAELIGAHQAGILIDVGEDDLGATEARGVGGRDKGQRRHDDRVARAEAESGVGEMQGGGAVGADDGVRGPDRLRERRLEALDHRPAGERRRAKDGRDRGHVVFVDRLPAVGEQWLQGTHGVRPSSRSIVSSRAPSSQSRLRSLE
jgi:hypothetical protein